MDDFRGGPNAALVFLNFLQADCRNSEYGKELQSLEQEINHTRDINHRGPLKDALDDGELETDGHLPSCFRASFHDIQPLAELPRNQNGADVRQLAEGLRGIADQLEHDVVAQAIQSLSSTLSNSPLHQWKHHLAQEVQRAMRQGVCLKDLAQEWVVVALTLTLVKGVCEKAPQLLRNLFDTALQYISIGGDC